MKKIETISYPLGISISVVILLSVSCLKDDLTPVDKKEETSKIQNFKNLNEFIEARNNVNSMTLLELRAYEESKGYISFGRICDELYSNFDPEEFKNIDEIQTFVSRNSDYFQLIKEENGDQTFEKVLYRNPDRYLINEEKMYKINDIVFKVFDEITISTKEANIDILKTIDLSNIGSYSNDTDFRITSIHKDEKVSQTVGAKDSPIPYVFCGDSFYDYAEEGRDMTKLWLNWIITDDGYGLRTYKTYLCIKPYKKTLGVWFSCSRTVSWDIDWASDIEVNGVWQRFYRSESGEESTSELRRFNTECITNSYNSFYYHFGGFVGWGRTPSAPVIYLNCTSNAF